MKRFIYFICIATMFISHTTSAKTIRIAVENRDFYPFFFVDNGIPKGILVDMVRDGTTPFGINPVFEALPIKRGFLMVKRGSVDAIISPRVQNQNFIIPEDAFKTNISKHRILQIDSVVVTYKGDYEFFGDIKTLPSPVRITLGDPIESLFELLVNQGLHVEDTAYSGSHNIKMLMRDKTGCLITTSLKAMKWLDNPIYRDNIDVSTEPVVTRSYFLIFSKKSDIKNNMIQLIWDKIAKNRDSYIYPIKLFTSY